ncbi:MAG: metallophosphoesterase [bacterium]
MLIIGDLHGDYYKLLRILQQKNIIVYNDQEKDIEKQIQIIDYETYIIFIGDYIDWRGEKLENPLNLSQNQLVFGTSKIIHLVSYLIQKRKNIFPLVGNHEDMMFNALKIVNKIGRQRFADILQRTYSNPYSLVRELSEDGILEDYLNFYNWYTQGGMNTIRSFDSNIDSLLECISNQIIFKELLVYVWFELEDNTKIVISHSFPDDLECIDRIVNNNIREEDVQIILWSRKIWGIDAFNGVRTEPTDQQEIIKALDKNNIRRYVIGHTRLSLDPFPYEYLDGRIINVDNHGVPFSEPFYDNQLKVKSFSLLRYNVNL